MAIEKREVKTRYYKLLKDVDESQKCPPQAKLILDTIKANGGRMERNALLEQLKRPVDQGGLKTNQTAERILGFYRPKMADLKVMVEEVETTTIDVEVPDKPAPAAANPGASAGGGATTGTDAGAGVKHDHVKGQKGVKKEAAA